MTNIIRYNPMNFNEVENVDIVDKTDSEYVQWQKRVYKPKMTDAQKRRNEEIAKYPRFFENLKMLWLSEEYEDEDRKIERCCENCCFSNIDKYDRSEFVCWKLHEELGYGRKPDKIEKYFVCEKFEAQKKYHSKEQYVKEKLKHSKLPHPKGFQRTIYSTISLRWYLYDLGALKDKPGHNIGEKARQNEYQFKSILKEITHIEIIDKIFKIYQKNNTINFKIPDVIFKKSKKYNIIEYKTETYYGNFQQLLDYGELFKLATIEPLENLYWVIHDIFSYDWLKQFKKQAPEPIQIYTEKAFILEWLGMEGLDAWM